MRPTLGCLTLGAALAAGASIAAAQQATPDTAWRDPSPHAVRTIAVEPGVSLEVLDWGGKGPAMVFLPGLGNTAHSFDAFAPRFRDRWHVYAITPRGFGASSHPDTGYSSRARARDVLATLDRLGVKKAILVGHSIAGDEMTRVAAERPERVRALVYLDSYSYGPAFIAMLDSAAPPLPPQADPPLAMTAADSASPAAFTAYVSRRYLVPGIEAEVRAFARFDSTGRLAMFQAPNASDSVYLESAPSEYARVRAPALAIYARHADIGTMFPEMPRMDSTNRRMAETYFAYMQRDHVAEVARFRKEMRCGIVRDGVVGSVHYVHYTHPAAVERMMRDFLGNRLPMRSKSCRVATGG